MSSLIGKIFGASEVVPPPPSVDSGSAATAAGNIAREQRRPASAYRRTATTASGNPRGSRNGSGASLGQQCGRSSALRWCCMAAPARAATAPRPISAIPESFLLLHRSVGPAAAQAIPEAALALPAELCSRIMSFLRHLQSAGAPASKDRARAAKALDSALPSMWALDSLPPPTAAAERTRAR